MAAYFGIASSLKSKLLRFALAKTGILDTDALDLDKLKFSLGRTTTAEFRDVGLRLEKLSALLQLPPSIRLLAARAILVRVSIAGDFTITAEVDGIEVHASIEESDCQKKAQSPTEPQGTPQHRKSKRRIPTLAAHDPSGQSNSGSGSHDDVRIPTVQDLAKSFVETAPAEEKEELETAILSQSAKMDESTASMESDETAVGTGNGLGLPVFLAGILQGVVDKLKLEISNVNLRCDATITSQTTHASNRKAPVSLLLNIGSVLVDSVTTSGPAYGSHNTNPHAFVGRRRISVQNVSLDLLCNAPDSAKLFQGSRGSSPESAHSRTETQTPLRRSSGSGGIGTEESLRSLHVTKQPVLPESFDGRPASTPTSPVPVPAHDKTSSVSPAVSAASVPTSIKGRFADADEDALTDLEFNLDSSEIRAGEDSNSYVSRRSQSSSEQDRAFYPSLEQSQNMTESIAEFQSSSNSGSEPFMFDAAHSRESNTFAHDDTHGNSEKNTEYFSSRLAALNQQLEAQDDEDIVSPQYDSESDGAMAESVIYGAEAGQRILEASMMSESMYRSTYEGTSMFESAVEHPAPSQYFRPPGAFPDDSDHVLLSQSTATVRSTGQATSGEREDGASTPKAQEISPAAPSPSSILGNMPPEFGSPSSSERGPDQIRKRMLTIDNIDVWLPCSGHHPDQEDVTSQSVMFDQSPQNSISAPSFGRNVPGTFSVHGDMGASRRLQASYMFDQPASSDSGNKLPSYSGSLDVDIGILSVQVDSSSIQSLQQLIKIVKLDGSGSERPPGGTKEPDEHAGLKVSLRVKALRAAFYEAMIELPLENADTLPLEPDQGKALIRFVGRDVTLGLTPHSVVPDITFAIRRFTADTNTKELLSFPRRTISRHDKGESPDILIKIQRSKVTLQGRPITDVRAWLRPVHINIDLLAIDEALGSFGGLSGIMELSGSVLSSGSEHVPPSPKRRGVHFQEDLKKPTVEADSPEIKLNVTLQGADLALRSYSCHLAVECSTLKLSVRSNYILATLSSAKVYEIPIGSSKGTPGKASANFTERSSRFLVDLKDIKLEYSPSPDDHDLERLISLITPSKDKYEDDDDILLDTLLRQRGKGAVLRLRVTSVLADITSWTFINDLQSLSEELSKFAAVAKYLPEDDRPGLLVMPRIIELNAHLPVNDEFGVLDVSCKEFQMAQIGLPSLVALSIGSFRAGPLGGDDLIHGLLRPTEQLPMVMMRMIGDEVEPTAKIKLLNMCIEYSVPTLLALVGTNSVDEMDKTLDDIAASVLSLAAVDIEEMMPRPRNPSGVPSPTTRKIGLDILLHDCAIGLKPRELGSKGMFVLSDTKFSTMLPPDKTFSAALELRKASLHIIDHEFKGVIASEAPRQIVTTDRVSSQLSAQGFVSVTSIMSARVTVVITEDPGRSTRSVEVEVRDDLIVLETCADSTQTLISILNGLSPPSLPNNEPKFRTEVMTMEDMMASFTGDAFPKPSAIPDTLFDMDEASPLSGTDALDASSILMDSTYGAPGGDLDLDYQDSFENDDELFEDEDYFEISDDPKTRQWDDDNLMKNVQRQCVQNSRGSAARLTPSYSSAQNLDKAHSMVLGAPYRFNTPSTPFPATNTEKQFEPFPLQVHVRDVHIIWNLYDGYDWEQTRNTISEAVEAIEQKLDAKKQRRRRSAEAEEEEESVIGDCLFNSIYIGVANNRDAGDLSRQISQQIGRGIGDISSESESYATSATSRPTQYSASRQARQQRPRKSRLRLTRSQTHKIAFELKGVSVDFSLHPHGSGETQSSVDVRLRDFEIFDNVPTSTWRKFLTYSYDEENMREMMKPMIHIELLTVQPVPELAATELMLRVSVLPLRLHVDQDALDFITRFFEFKADSTTPTNPVDPPFIQRIEVNTVNMCLDYKPKKVDYAGIRSGHTGEFKNFVILDRANIKLKHVIVYGVKGFDALHPTLSDIWTPDVIKTQLPGVLAGLSPLRPLVSLGAGIRDVVAIPVREYKKDGRLVRSVQKGAFHFAKTTTAELARLGAKLAVGTQTVLSGVEDTLGYTSHQGDEDLEHEERRLVSNYADQPLGIFQGLRSARQHLERDLLTAKDAFIAVQGEVMDSGSAAGAAKAVARHAPTIILRPVIGASKAVGQTFMGVSNQVDRANVRRNEDKYKQR